MLVTFHSKNYYPITMFGDVALQLLQGMGLNPKSHRALLMPTMCRRHCGNSATMVGTAANDGSWLPEPEFEVVAPPVSIKLRAVPLLQRCCRGQLQGKAWRELGFSGDKIR